MEKKKYIEIKDDDEVDALCAKIGLFEETVLREVHYVSGSYLKDDELKTVDDLAEATFVFDCRVKGGFQYELVFGHITRLNIVPSEIQYDSSFSAPEIYFQEDRFILSRYEEDPYEDISYFNTWVESKTLKWRIVPQTRTEKRLRIKRSKRSKSI